jgi:hypothetical protein
MITIESTDKEVRVSIPRDEVDALRLEQWLRPIRLEASLAASQLADDDADRMAEEMKDKWWAENRHQFLSKDLD